MTNAATKTPEMRFSRMNEALIKKTMKGLDLVGGKDLESRAKTLQAFFLKQKQDGKIAGPMALCEGKEGCNGVSPADLPECPFCGESEDNGEASKPNGIAKDAQVEAADDEAADETAEDEVVKEAPVMADPRTTTLVKVERQRQIVKPGRTGEKELDKLLEKFRALRKQFGVTGYDIAVVVKQLHDTEAWKLRTKSEKGDRAFQTFPQFVQAELEISRSHAYYLVGVASKYTREEVAEVGASKLRWLMRLDGEAHTRLLEAAKTDKVSARDLQAKVQGTANAPKLKGKGVTPAKAAKAKLERAKALSVMVTAPEKLILTLLSSASSKSPKPAKDLNDDPWVEEAHENGVTTRYQVKLDAKTGEIKLHIVRRRGAAK